MFESKIARISRYVHLRSLIYSRFINHDSYGEINNDVIGESGNKSRIGKSE